LRQRIPDQADELVRQNERSVVVRLQITKLQGTIAYFGEHAAFIGSKDVAVVIVDEPLPS
jgi:hypothetical protein